MRPRFDFLLHKIVINKKNNIHCIYPWMSIGEKHESPELKNHCQTIF